MKIKQLVLALAACAFGSFVSAETITVSGIGKSPIGEDIALTRSQALQAAKRDALVAAVNKLNGPRAANDPKAQAAIDTMLSQLGDDVIADQSGSTDAAKNFVLKITLSIEDLQLRQLLQDAGIAKTTSRQFPVLIVMDEFFTTATDKTKPLRELVEFSSDRGSSYSVADKESANSNYSASSTSASSSQEERDVAMVADDGQTTVAARGKKKKKSASVNDQSESASAAYSRDNSVSASEHDKVTFKKLVEYQPQNVGPDKQNFTYSALLREAGKYDLNFIDNDLFRSKYFKTGKPLTLEELQNGPELARYVQAARDFKADYFMVGNSIIIQGKVDDSTGQYTCDGLVSLKSYSTEDGTALASDARTESASGNSPDQCRVNVANKLAKFVGSTVGSAIGNYWRQRDTYGREYTVRLVSLLGKLSEDNKDDFADALEKIKGVQNKVVVRRSDRQNYEVSITYKGDSDLAREIRRAAKEKEGFGKIGRKTDGTTMMFCLEGDCPEK